MKAEPLGEPVCVVVSRDDVEAQDITSVLSALRRLMKSPETARAHMEKVDIAFDGYNESSQEVFEIPEVRNFVYRLDQEFPFWLFFLSKQFPGLYCLALCFMPPFLTKEAKARIFTEKLHDLLKRRWVPAMNEVAQFAGLDEDATDRLLDRSLLYLQKGPLKLPIEE